MLIIITITAIDYGSFFDFESTSDVHHTMHKSAVTEFLAIQRISKKDTTTGQMMLLEIS